MKRFVAIAIAATAASCAHDTMPALRGRAELAPQMLSVEPLLDGHRGLNTWAPSVLYPSLDPVGPLHLASSAQVAADGPMQATAWLWFRAYQSTLSRVDGSTCRFRPTCSGFGIEAVREYGLVGIPMTFGRLHRSHADEEHYPMSLPPFLDDPLSNYGFTRRKPRLDDFASYGDPAHAWYQHVRATRRLR